MIIVNRTEKNIVGSISGKPFSIPFKESTFKKLKSIEEGFAKIKTKGLIEVSIKEAKELTTLNFGELVASKNPYLMFNPVKNKYFLVINKGKKDELIDDRELPDKLAEKIQDSFEQDFDYMPLVKTWGRFLQRDVPYDIYDAALFTHYLTSMYIDYDKVDELVEKEGLDSSTARERCTFNDLAVTQEGLLATYKVVEEIIKEWVIVTDDDGNIVLDSEGIPKKKQVLMDQYKSQYKINPITGETTTKENKPRYVEDRLFTPALYKNGENFYSGKDYGYIYKVGEAQYLPEIHPTTGKPAKINHSNTIGGGGLYTGGLDYIKNYRGEQNPVLVCFLDPANIISFQSEGQAIRTWELFPHNILEDEAELKGFYHSSEYAKESKERTNKRFEDIISKRQEELDQLKEVSNKLNNL